MDSLTMRDAFFDRLYEIALKDRDVIIVSADMGAPSLDKFRENLAEQFINVGIAEANLVTVATGLALGGKKVFIYAIMPFVTSRCYEFLKVDVSLMNIPITIVGVGPGFGYDDSGPTHHCTEDISIMRALPNITILSPSDTVMTRSFAQSVCEQASPSYIRLDRKVQPILYDQKETFSEGCYKHREGSDVCIVATGNMVHRALEVASELSKRSIKASVIDVYVLKPLNKKALITEIADAKKIVSIEEHLLDGGFGSIISEMITDEDLGLSLKRFGVQDKYIYAYGGRDNLQKLCGLDKEFLVKEIAEWLDRS